MPDLKGKMMKKLSTEAQVVSGTWWGTMHTDMLSFERPHIIHPSTRKGLDDLVKAGLLIMTPRNDSKDPPLDWKPTHKMKTDRPKVSLDFIKEHGFPVTTE